MPPFPVSFRGRRFIGILVLRLVVSLCIAFGSTLASAEAAPAQLTPAPAVAGESSVVTAPVLRGTAGDRRIDLSWTAAKGRTITAYWVKRSIGDASFSLIASLPATARKYGEGHLTNGVRYTYRVRAIYAGGTVKSNDVTLRPTPTPSPSPTAPTPAPTPTPSGGSGGVPAFDHIFVVVDENRAYSQIIGSGSAPYLNALAQQYGLATNYHAIRHPSLPNYLALIGGDTFGVTSDCPALGSGACTPDAVNLADRIEASGRQWGAYFESMPSPCDTSVSANHDPFIHFDDIRTDAARCASHLLPYAALSRDLASDATTPDLVFISANDSHNMHTGSIAAGDSWLKNNLAAVFNSPAWTAGKSLLLITWDEDDGSEGNRVVTILVGPSVRPAFSSATAHSHYALLRTIEAAWGLAPLTANDGSAAPLSEFFRQPAVGVSPSTLAAQGRFRGTMVPR